MISFKPLEASDIEARVGTCSEKGVSLLLYKDARCDMRALDEAVGPEHWQCSYESIDGKLFCTVSVWDSQRGWVSKQDVGTPSNMESEKGEASDAFKRACFKWGIGRELYTAPFVWVPAEKLTRHNLNQRSGKWQCFDRFTVTVMEVEDGRITALEIVNENLHEAVFSKGGAKTRQPADGWKKALFKEIGQLKNEAVSLGLSEDAMTGWVSTSFNGRPLTDMTQDELRRIRDHIKDMVKAVRDGR